MRTLHRGKHCCAWFLFSLHLPLLSQGNLSPVTALWPWSLFQVSQEALCSPSSGRSIATFPSTHSDKGPPSLQTWASGLASNSKQFGGSRPLWLSAHILRVAMQLDPGSQPCHLGPSCDSLCPVVPAHDSPGCCSHSGLSHGHSLPC